MAGVVMQTIAEIHTSDLTDSCMKRVQLRHEGKQYGEYSTALYRGQLAHAALEFLHRPGTLDAGEIELALRHAKNHVEELANAEQRPLSDSVVKKQKEIVGEVRVILNAYVERQAEYVSECDTIGIEIPIRWTFDTPMGTQQDFASHLDWLYRDPNGQLVCRDWKWRQDSPSMAYLGRHMQFTLYHLMLAHGEVFLPADFGDSWVSLGEFAEFEWCHLPYFKPYSRKTTVQEEEGEVVYQKGDARPLRMAIRRWTYSPDREDDMLAELSTRVAMLTHGIYPTNPDPIGCHICECAAHCPAFHKDLKGTNA